MTKKRYWGYRINTNEILFFNKELSQGRLRQGWGYDERQDLRHMTFDGGAGKNLRMLQEVKRGDIIFVPRVPQLDRLTILMANDNWDKTYSFEIIEEQEEYGHTFPVSRIAVVRYTSDLPKRTRLSFFCHRRFWSLDKYNEEIETWLPSIIHQ